MLGLDARATYTSTRPTPFQAAIPALPLVCRAASNAALACSKLSKKAYTPDQHYFITVKRMHEKEPEIVLLKSILHVAYFKYIAYVATMVRLLPVDVQ